jgi:hypothetical protein
VHAKILSILPAAALNQASTENLDLYDYNLDMIQAKVEEQLGQKQLPYSYEIVFILTTAGNHENTR